VNLRRLFAAQNRRGGEIFLIPFLYDGKAGAAPAVSVAGNPMYRVLLPALLWLLCCAGHAEAARLVVTVDGLHSAKGDVYVALYSKPDEFPDGDYSDQHLKVKASTRPITVVFDHLRPGTYAVGAYHDEDSSGHLETNFLGYPTDGYALSNGIRAIISRPRFVDAAFSVGHGDTHVALHIEY
jgi:uncharacterized protein (DUF2141 family)